MIDVFSTNVDIISLIRVYLLELRFFVLTMYSDGFTVLDVFDIFLICK